MNHRLFKHAIFAGAILTAASYADTCKEITLYDGSDNKAGRMEESSRSFPEGPEWTANWGDFNNMSHPYIRLSGQKNLASDWKGALQFDTFPLTLKGGNIRMKVRSTQNGKFGLWISGTSGTSRIQFENVVANSTMSLDIPLSQIYDGDSFSVEKIWVGLFDVPTYQYTTLFIDDIVLSCTDGSAEALSGSLEDSLETAEIQGYDFSDVTASSPVRESLSGAEPVSESRAAHTAEEQNGLRTQTEAKFVLNGFEHQQIVNTLKGKSASPKESREGWYNSMFLVNRNRLQDSVIANPKNIFLEADAVAASYDMQKMPLLIGDLDYSYRVCTDSLCSKAELKDYSLLIAGLPSSYTSSSKVSILYDPYFVATNRGTLPEVEICTAKGCNSLKPKTELPLEFNSAGIQKITVKMKSEKTSIQQTLYMEVK